ncbi:MAG: glycosyltransferase [Armatimonadota bacterium]
MKYCVIGPIHPLRGGIAHHTTLLCQNLASRHEINAISFKRLYPSILFPGKSQVDESKAEESPDAEWMIDSVNPLTWTQTGNRIRDINPDYLIVQWWHPFFAPCMATITAKAHPAKVIYICHNVLPHESNPLMKPLTLMALKHGNGFIVHSNEQMETLKQILPNHPVATTVMPQFDMFSYKGISKEDAKSQLGLNGKVILFFGLVRKYKGLMDLVHAMDILRNEGITCLVAGEFYDNRDQYTSEIEKLGLGSIVKVIDRYIPNDEVEPYFAASDVVVLPYLSSTQSAIVQMAYRFERPVIATSVGGIPEAVDEGITGLLVPPNNPKELAGAIRRFYAESMDTGSIEAVRTIRSRFSWDSVIGTIESLGAAL